MRRVLFAGILAVLIAAPAGADESPTAGRGEVIGGRDLAQWTISWTRWAFSFTRSQARRATDCLPQEESGPVRFLGVRTREEHVVEVHCSVSAAQYLMLAQPGVTCTDVVPNPDFPTTPKGLGRCAHRFWRELTDPHPRVVLDGRAIGAGPAVSTGFFRFTMPARDNQLRLPGTTRVGASAVNRATLIRPLTSGTHTLITGVRYRGTHNMVVVYKLTVV